MAHLYHSFDTYNHEKLLQYIREEKNAQAISIIDYHLQSRNSFGYKRSAALHYAFKCNNLIIVEHLVGKGANLEGVDGNGENLLTSASSAFIYTKNENFNIDKYILSTKSTWPNDLQILNVLLHKLTSGCSNNNDIAQKLVRVHCPLAAVVSVFKSVELIKLMIDDGCPVDSRLVSTGETALHLAVEYLDVEQVQMLVRYNAEIDAKDYKDSTPLSRFQMGLDDPDEKLEILRILLDQGASLTSPCSKIRRHGNNCDLNRTVKSQLLSEGDDRTLRLLISRVDLLEKGADGKRPLHDLISNKGADINELLKGGIQTRVANVRDYHFFVFGGTFHNEFCNNRGIGYVLYETLDAKEKANVTELLQFYKILIDKHVSTSTFITHNWYNPAAKTCLDLAKCLLAHFALLESFGVPLNESIHEKISSVPTYKDHFDSCIPQIENMKTTAIYESITLHTLLRGSLRILILYSRNEDFQLNYESVKKYIHELCSHYVYPLTFRVDKAMDIAKMQNKAACLISKRTGLFINISYSIVEYLRESDLRKLSQI